MAPSLMVDSKDLPPDVLEALGISALNVSVLSSSLADDLNTQVTQDESAVLSEISSSKVTTSASMAQGWEVGLEADAVALLATDRTDVWEELIKRFESRLILTALSATRGRRIEAATKLGIGRNTITRKIQELGLDP